MKNKINLRVKSFAFFVLKLIAVGSVIGIGITFPNLLNAVKGVSTYHRRITRAKSKLMRALYYLESKKLVTLYQRKDKDFIKITKHGQKRISYFDLENLRLKTTNRWDKKWRLVVFDIPEDKKNTRDALARKLKEIGFFRLQDSVWITPYNCEEEVDYLKEIYNIRSFVRLALVEKLDGQEILERKFGLF